MYFLRLSVFLFPFSLPFTLFSIKSSLKNHACMHMLLIYAHSCMQETYSHAHSYTHVQKHHVSTYTPTHKYAHISTQGYIHSLALISRT